ncbi:MAG: hypothetical protein AB7F22_17670 [Reyranella sp.]|uniref:PASTA domain-containing protein n=1 Tax=Reyranella sp. TaxID=1929291 RepID=UPI003D12EE4E
MKRILPWALALLLAAPVPAHAAIDQVVGGSGNSAVDGGPIEPVLPAHDTGDLLGCVTFQKSYNGTATVTETASTGWTKRHQYNGTDRMTLWAKIATSSSETNPVFDYSDNTSTRTVIGACFKAEGTEQVADLIDEASDTFTSNTGSNISTAAITPSVNNTMVLVCGAAADNIDSAGIPALSGMMELFEADRAAASAMLVCDYVVQTTAATFAATEFVDDGGGSANGYSFSVAIKAAAVTPLYTSDPAIQSRTTSSIVFRATTDTTGTRYGARLTDGSATPTCDQLEAQTATGGVQYGSQAATATVASDLTLGSITDGTVTDYYECLEDSSGNDSAVKAVANVYKTPAWTTAPSVTAQDDNDYTITKVLDGAGSCTAVACLKDSTAPSEAETLAGYCDCNGACDGGAGDVAAIATVTDASCEAGTATLGGALTRPIHDIYVAATYGSQNSALTTLADEMLDAPTGYQYDLLTSISATSPCQELNDIPISPTIAATDVLKTSTTVAPSGEDLTVETDCNMDYADPNGSRRSASLAVYDTSVGDWMSGGPTAVYFNNSAPECLVANCEFDTGELFIDGEEMAEIDTATWFDDADGDTPTITSSDTGTGTGADKLPAGTTFVDGSWSGTPTCDGGDTSGSFTVTDTDVAGDTAAVAVTWACYDQVAVPDCVGDDLATCASELEAVSLSLGTATFEPNESEAFGTILSQDPEAASSANPFTTVDVAVSSGTSSQRLGLGLRIDMEIN